MKKLSISKLPSYFTRNRTLETLLSQELTKKGYAFTEAQLAFICNTSHKFTNGKTFNNWIPSYRNIDLMVENFLEYRLLNKYESDFNQF
jgi:hypothetical protein